VFVKGSTLISVNGKSCSKLDFVDILALFDGTAGMKELVIIIKAAETPKPAVAVTEMKEGVKAPVQNTRNPTMAPSATFVGTPKRKQVSMKLKRARREESLGMGIAPNGEFAIDKVIAASSAQRAGVCVGDVLVSVDGKSTKGMRHANIIAMLVSAGTTVAIVVKRG
jgi:C-terminal processing protease CtpA/Prc